MEAKTKETKHTPGPWSWVIQDYSMATLCGPDVFEHEVMSVSPCKSCQSAEKGFRWGFCNVPSEADAELIAQAPALSERVRELEEENERLIHALENSSRELYALMSHCVDQNFINPEEETDGYKDYEMSIQLSTSVLSKARNNG